jgi:septal ring factor EnvC (AmiA/AmiB activator)
MVVSMRARAAVALLTLLLVTAGVGRVDGQVAPAPGTPASGELELEAIRDEIARLQGKLNQVRQQRVGAASELARTDLELQLLESQVAEAVAARNVAAERAGDSARQIAGLETTLAAVRNDLRRRLVGLYRLGGRGVLRLVLAIRPDRNLLSAIRQLRYLARRDGSALDLYLDTQARLVVEREELGRQRHEREAWLAREEERRRQLLAGRRRQAALLASVDRQQQELSARASELADKEKKLSTFLDVLFGKVGEAALTGRAIQDFRGVLEWPLRGRVVEPFGPRLDPRYHTRVPHNGIDLEVQAGSTVRSIYPGTVIFAAPFEGYGLAVVVNHPGRVLTLYAGLERLGVANGDVVSLKGELGRVSSKLYFEIRVENRPEDPLRWLR